MEERLTILQMLDKVVESAERAYKYAKDRKDINGALKSSNTRKKGVFLKRAQEFHQEIVNLQIEKQVIDRFAEEVFRKIEDGDIEIRNMQDKSWLRKMKSAFKKSGYGCSRRS